MDDKPWKQLKEYFQAKVAEAQGRIKANAGTDEKDKKWRLAHNLTEAGCYRHVVDMFEAYELEEIRKFLITGIIGSEK